ncbi:hypothetical protein C8R43DRAFT_933306 [Mycena crocata]|nr:hypothetical protein C8R43DRAFT_933306 [Mycena crocata]
MASLRRVRHLPPEVVDMVIEGNHDDRDYLATCSLVCKDWLPCSRHHLFSEHVVFISPHDFTGATESCLNLLRHPLCTIAYHIRNISYHSRFPEPFYEGKRVQFISRLAKLTNITSLHVSGSIPDGTLALLARNFRKVTTLRVANVFSSLDDVTAFAGMFPALKRLDFDPPRFGVGPSTAKNDAPLSPNLHSLELHSPFKHWSWFLGRHREVFTSLSLGQIRTIDITVVKQILAESGAHLRHLSLSFSDPRSALEFSATASYLCNLKLSSLAIESPWGIASSSLVELLENAGSLINLRILTWKFQVFNYGKDTGAFWVNFPWAKIDAKISDRAVFGSLRRFCVFTDSPHPMYRGWDRCPKAEAVGIKTMHVNDFVS